MFSAQSERGRRCRPCWRIRKVEVGNVKRWRAAQLLSPRITRLRLLHMSPTTHLIRYYDGEWQPLQKTAISFAHLIPLMKPTRYKTITRIIRGFFFSTLEPPWDWLSAWLPAQRGMDVLYDNIITLSWIVFFCWLLCPFFVVHPRTEFRNIVLVSHDDVADDDGGGGFPVNFLLAHYF